MRAFERTRRGFTLIEVLVVVAIIGILFALLLPAVNSVREAARRAQCVNNLVQLGVALQNYHAAFESFPPGVVEPKGPIFNLPRGSHLSWMVKALPYLEQGNAFNQLDLSAGAYDPRNSTVRAHVISTFICPSDAWSLGAGGAAPTSYAGCHHDVEAPIDVTNNGMLFLNRTVRMEDVADGPSFTLLVGDKLASPTDLGWISGTSATLRNTGGLGGDFLGGVGSSLAGDDVGAVAPDGRVDPDLEVGAFRSRHPGGGGNFLMVDGSVRFVRYRFALQRLANRADGELIDGNEY